MYLLQTIQEHTRATKRGSRQDPQTQWERHGYRAQTRMYKCRVPRKLGTSLSACGSPQHSCPNPTLNLCNPGAGLPFQQFRSLHNPAMLVSVLLVSHPSIQPPSPLFLSASLPFFPLSWQTTKELSCPDFHPKKRPTSDTNLALFLFMTLRIMFWFCLTTPSAPVLSP